MTLRLKIAVVVLGLALVAPVHSQPTIQPLSEAESSRDCGCSFSTPYSSGPKGQTILQWTEGLPASMRINGKPVALHAESTYFKNLGQLEAVDDHALFSLTGDGVLVVARCTATKICADESCESTEYKAAISIATQKGKQQITAWGVCGC